MDRDGKLQCFRAFIVLTAGLIVFVCDFLNRERLTMKLVHLFLTLVIAYICANIVVWIIKKALDMPNKEQLAAEELALKEAEEAGEAEEEAGAEEETEQV